jgi:hypothetical protein
VLFLDKRKKQHHSVWSILQAIAQIFRCKNRTGMTQAGLMLGFTYTSWFKYDRDYLCVNKSQFVPVISEPPCTYTHIYIRYKWLWI